MKEVKESEKVIQKSVGFYKRQLEFIKVHKDFDINKLCRDKLDEQIKLIDNNYLEQFID